MEIRPVHVIVGIILGIILLTFAIGGWSTVGAGNRGVRLRFGAVSGDPLPEGLCMKWPFIDTIAEFEVRTQKHQIDDQASSKDLQIVHVVIATNYNVDPASVCNIYQTYGVNYVERILEPNIREAVKATTAQYTAEELIVKRELVRNGVKTLLASKMPVGIKLDELNIVNFNFSDAFNHSIEQKVTAEQNALAAKNKLAQVEFEAQQRAAESTGKGNAMVAEAKGKAESIKIESEALRANPEIITLRTLERWDGKLPMATSGAIPFLDLMALSKTVGTKPVPAEKGQ